MSNEEQFSELIENITDRGAFASERNFNKIKDVVNFLERDQNANDEVYGLQNNLNSDFMNLEVDSLLNDPELQDEYDTDLSQLIDAAKHG